MKKHIVSIVKCKSYDKKEVEAALNKCLSPLGGIDNFVKRGQHVALKPNLLMAADPNKAVTTNPAVAGTVYGLVKAQGAKPLFIESPGGPVALLFIKRVVKKCGYENFNFNYDFSEKTLVNKKAAILKRIGLMKKLVDSDVIINLPKLKTHGLMTLTCAVKNLFGSIPGIEKVGYHTRFPDKESFGRMLFDIAIALKPDLTIVDAIACMDGNGPSWGKKKKLGLIIAGTDAFAVDFVCCRLTGMEPENIPYLNTALKEGYNPSKIEIICDYPLNSLKKQFILPEPEKKSALFTFVVSRLSPQLKNFLSVKPAMNKKCVGCGICVRSCPKKAITIVDKRAKIDYSKCIRCYCCHELCPHNAVYLKKNILNRLFLE